MSDHDVIVVGYGPTGKLLARLLSDAGHSVAVVERWPAAYPLPRAVGYDHEIKRMFHSIGLAREIEAISRPMRHYVWCNADWKTLVDIDFSQESISGGPGGYLFNQPDLERVLERDLASRPGVAVFAGFEALTVEQTANEALVRLAPFDAQTREADKSRAARLTGRYIVGCDGANSLVRNAIGAAEIDHGFDSQWLVVDVRPHDLSQLPIPDAAQWCNPERPTTIVPSGVANRRFEFMIKPGERPEAFEREAKVWELLAPWMKPSEGVLVRHAVYRFRSLLAKTWRKGRLLIAGDAAHLMPPFMGQGMCSGLRDAWNLAWKLDRVLRANASEQLLDAYETERSPQVDAFIRISIEMGKVVCVADPAAAAARDAAFFDGQVPPPPQPPGILDGVVARKPNGRLAAHAGQLLPHDELKREGVTARLDAVVGRAFYLLIDSESLGDLSDEDLSLARQLEVAILPVGRKGYRDVKGRLSALLADNQWAAILARPDFYAYGAAASVEDVGGLLRGLAAQIGASTDR